MLTEKEKENLLPKFHEFNKKHGFISWAYAFRENEESEITKIVQMVNRPCYGEMRAYGVNSTRPQDPKPGDLPRPMKAQSEHGGFREAVSVAFTSLIKDKTEENIKVYNRYVRFLFGPESPYIAGLDIENMEFTESEAGEIEGVVMWGTDVDPTAMVACFMTMRSTTFTSMRAFGQLIDDFGATEREAFLLAYNFILTVNRRGEEPDIIWAKYCQQTYVMAGGTIPKKVFDQDFNTELSRNGKWRGGEDYNRPDLARGFEGPVLGEVIRLGSAFEVKEIADKFGDIPGWYSKGCFFKDGAEAFLSRLREISS